MQHYVHFKNDWTGASEPLKLRLSSRPPLRVPDGVLIPGQNVADFSVLIWRAVRDLELNSRALVHDLSHHESKFDN